MATTRLRNIINEKVFISNANNINKTKPPTRKDQNPITLNKFRESGFLLNVSIAIKYCFTERYSNDSRNKNAKNRLNRTIRKTNVKGLEMMERLGLSKRTLSNERLTTKNTGAKNNALLIRNVFTRF